jgi:hypothetical protein
MGSSLKSLPAHRAPVKLPELDRRTVETGRGLARGDDDAVRRDPPRVRRELGRDLHVRDALGRALSKELPEEDFAPSVQAVALRGERVGQSNVLPVKRTVR